MKVLSPQFASLQTKRANNRNITTTSPNAGVKPSMLLGLSASNVIKHSIISNSINNTKFASVHFNGNPRHVAMLSMESKYFSDGGVGSVIDALPKKLYEKYGKGNDEISPDKQIDVRVFNPMYNAVDGLKKVEGSKDKYTLQKYGENTKYNLKHTGIKAEFDYGVRHSEAELFEIIDDKNPVPTYLIKSDALDNTLKQYYEGKGRTGDMFDSSAAVSMAFNALKEKMKDSEAVDNFDIGVAHFHDSQASFGLPQLKKQDKDLRAVITLHNVGGAYQTLQEPFRAALNAFSQEKINTLLNDDVISRELTNLMKYRTKQFNNGELNEAMFGPKVNKFIKEGKTEFNEKEKLAVLNDIADNYNYYSNEYNLNFNILNNRVKEIFPKASWGNNGKFSPLVRAINTSDAWNTVSNTHFKELMNIYEFAPDLPLKANIAKGSGQVNGIDEKLWNPVNPKVFGTLLIHQPFAVEEKPDLYSQKVGEKEPITRKEILNYKEGKAENKKYIKSLLTKENLHETKKMETGGFLEKGKAHGYLNDTNGPLAVLISRSDYDQKGIDILMKSAVKFLKENPKLQIVIGGPEYKRGDENLENFINAISFDPDIAGRAVFYDGRVPTKTFVAGADMVLMPSRREPCGLVQLEGMSMGAIPIVSNTGGLVDTVEDPGERKGAPNGFRTYTEGGIHFANDAIGEFASAVERACHVYENNSELWDEMVQNTLSKDVSWDKAADYYNNEFYKIPERARA